MEKINKFMEVFWLSVMVVAMIMAIYMIAKAGWEDGFLYLLFPVLAGAMYSFRRFLRKRAREYDKGNDKRK